MAYLKPALVFLLVSLLLLPIIADGVSYSVPVSVTVNPAYTLFLGINILNDRVLAGGNLNISLELEKTGREGEVGVDLDYEIITGKKTLSSGYIGSVNVSDYKEETVQIPIPGDMKPGKYNLIVTAAHPQAYPDSDEDNFWVKKKCAWWAFWCWLW